MTPRNQAMPVNSASFLQVADTELMRLVAEDMYVGWCTKAFLAKQRFDRINAAAAKLEYLNKEGWNEDSYWLEIDRVSYAYWAQREGRDCWSDEQFRREYARDNPGSVRRNVTGHTIITSGFDSTAA